MKRNNYKKKMRDGFRNYVKYEFKYNGQNYELKCVAERRKTYNHGYIVEHPYFLKKLKRNDDRQWSTLSCDRSSSLLFKWQKYKKI